MALALAVMGNGSRPIMNCLMAFKIKREKFIAEVEVEVIADVIDMVII